MNPASVPQRDAASPTVDFDAIPLTPQQKREQRKERFMRKGKSLARLGYTPRPPEEVSRTLREMAHLQTARLIWDKDLGGVTANHWAGRDSTDRANDSASPGTVRTMQIITTSRPSKLERRSQEYPDSE